MGPPQWVKAIAGHLNIFPGSPFPFWYAKPAPEKSRRKSPVLRVRVSCSVWFHSRLSQHRKAPAFPFLKATHPGWPHSPESPFRLHNNEPCKCEKYNKLTRQKLYVWHRVSIKHTLGQEEPGCLADENYHVSMQKAFCTVSFAFTFT